MCISQLLTRFKDVEKIIWNNNPEMMVVNDRFGGDHDLYNKHMYLNLLITLILTIIGLLNCWMIIKFYWWREIVPIINTIVVCSYVPPFYIYNFDEVVMLCIPMHIFQVLTVLTNTESIITPLISCFILFGWDIFHLSYYILDSERLYENRYNIMVFCNIYLISCVCWAVIF